jgi:hypothetical protein
MCNPHRGACCTRPRLRFGILSNSWWAYQASGWKHTRHHGGLQVGGGAAAAADALLLASGADFFSAESFAKKGTNTTVVSASLESGMYCLCLGGCSCGGAWSVSEEARCGGRRQGATSRGRRWAAVAAQILQPSTNRLPQQALSWAEVGADPKLEQAAPVQAGAHIACVHRKAHCGTASARRRNRACVPLVPRRRQRSPGGQNKYLFLLPSPCVCPSVLPHPRNQEFRHHHGARSPSSAVANTPSSSASPSPEQPCRSPPGASRYGSVSSSPGLAHYARC